MVGERRTVMNRNNWIAVAALTMTLVLAGGGLALSGVIRSSATGGGTITITGHDMRFEPKVITAVVGRPLTITFKNAGLVEHDLNVEGLEASDARARNASKSHAHPGAVSELHVSADPGGTATLTLTPTSTGTFTVWCSVAGHKEAGMVALLTITPS